VRIRVIGKPPMPLAAQKLDQNKANAFAVAGDTGGK
jgi:hypothetical protein